MKFDVYKTRMLANGYDVIYETLELFSLGELVLFVRTKEDEGKYIAVTFNTDTNDGMMVESSTFAEHIHALTSLELEKERNK